ncbi:MAG: hypothetical protein WAR24_23645, partial [Candidatus Acidiferrales bacterium]
MSDDIRVACCLSDAELRKREATLLAQFKSALMATEELPDGYAFRVPGDKKWIAVVAELIVAERECCPFLTFELAAQPNYGASDRPRDWPCWYKGLFENHLLQTRRAFLTFWTSGRLLPANFLNHTPKSCRREGLFSFSWIFVSGGRSSASGSDLAGQRRGRAPMS